MLEKDKCYPFPCENDGDCIDHGTHYECKCSRRFKGIHCEGRSIWTWKNMSHRRYHQRCHILKSNLKNLIILKHCIVEDKCYDHPCKNGGTCNQLLSDVKCNCRSGYRGSFCQG